MWGFSTIPRLRDGGKKLKCREKRSARNAPYILFVFNAEVNRFLKSFVSQSSRIWFSSVCDLCIFRCENVKNIWWKKWHTGTHMEETSGNVNKFKMLSLEPLRFFARAARGRQWKAHNKSRKSEETLASGIYRACDTEAHNEKVQRAPSLLRFLSPFLSAGEHPGI